MSNKRILSFKYAFEGIWTALKQEPNLKFHLLSALIVILFGLIFNISKIEWLFIIVAIGLVFSLELTNTAIEEIVDSFTKDVHPAAKKAKDVASAAVLVAAVTALLIGLFVFLPYLI